MKKVCYTFVLFCIILSCCKPEAAQQAEVKVRLERDPESLNPVNASNTTANQLLNLLYQSLLTVDLEDGEIKPLLASSLPQQVIKDSLTYFYYTIRPEAKWDTGKPITTADIAFSLKALKAPLLNNQWVKPYFDFIIAVESDSADTRKFALVCKGHAPDLILLSGEFVVLPKEIADPKGILEKLNLAQLISKADSLTEDAAYKQFAADFNELTARKGNLLSGSGAYTLTNWKTGSYLQLQRKENWWGSPLNVSHIQANPQAILFQIIPDVNTALLALRNKQIDLMDNIPVVVFKQLQQDKTFQESFNLFTPSTYEVTYLGLNSRLPQFSDPETRQAIARLINTKEIIQVVQNTFATQTASLINPADTRYYNRDLKAYTYNKEQAFTQLAGADWKNSQQKWTRNRQDGQQVLQLKIAYKAGNAVHENAALLIQQSLQDAGIPVQLQALEGAAFSKALKTHEFDAFIRTLSGNPFSFNFTPILHTASAKPGGLNVTGFGNSFSDSLISAISNSRNEKERTENLLTFQELMYKDASMIFLFFNQDRIAVNKKFENLKISGLKPGYDLSAFQEKQ